MAPNWHASLVNVLSSATVGSPFKLVKPEACAAAGRKIAPLSDAELSRLIGEIARERGVPWEGRLRPVAGTLDQPGDRIRLGVSSMEVDMHYLSFWQPKFVDGERSWSAEGDYFGMAQFSQFPNRPPAQDSWATVHLSTQPNQAYFLLFSVNSKEIVRMQSWTPDGALHEGTSTVDAGRVGLYVTSGNKAGKTRVSIGPLAEGEGSMVFYGCLVTRIS